MVICMMYVSKKNVFFFKATLVLEPSTTFSELQGKIELELNVKADSQKIRYGFPPKELTAPIEGQESEPVPLQNGDRVTVEVVSSKGETCGQIVVWRGRVDYSIRLKFA